MDAIRVSRSRPRRDGKAVDITAAASIGAIAAKNALPTIISAKQIKVVLLENIQRYASHARQSHDAKGFAALVEQYTDITELTEELLHTLIENVVVHEKEIIDGETVMWIDIYYRFIGKIGNEDGKSLKTQKTRQSSNKLAPGA